MSVSSRMLGQGFTRLLRCQSGVSAVEFALISPLALLLLAATVDLGHLLTISRKIDEISATTADIISQQGTWTKTGVSGLLSGMSFILQPYDTSSLKITIAIEDVSASGTATVNWSAALNTSPLSTGVASPFTVPNEIQQDGVQMVMARVQYTYSSPLSALLSNMAGVNGYSFDRHSFARPRVSDTISY